MSPSLKIACKTCGDTSYSSVNVTCDKCSSDVGYLESSDYEFADDGKIYAVTLDGDGIPSGRGKIVSCAHCRNEFLDWDPESYCHGCEHFIDRAMEA